MKRCSKCKIEKPKSLFYVCGGKIQSRCKVCMNKYFQQYAEENRERKRLWIVKSKKKAALSNPERLNARYAVYRAVKKGDLIKTGCEVCGELKTQAHHFMGYEKENWLKVKWLCKKHHLAEHGHQPI